ncbi:MAG: phosphopantothenoylcysteine decarboxylase/phosphopantothenate/cysteine ligase [Deltaproteobacteria bacterium]|jgi:phosphopantothenoylcysteine decarboxylase/phosphopantothenate--cysteine ligase|nr:phosphopantothenoylcysteine decarboxylase/phosphopantothenate/cysteine ligase [Deltaproteobacteria bacterium]
MKGRKVIVGVTGGIAAYKAAELVRLLAKEGAVTRVAMTHHATKFITPLTLETLSGNRVIADMWSPETHPLDHITWGQDSELIIIAPATANFIGKMAHGIGDDFLSTLVIAATARVLVCPAMNTQMYLNNAVQENLRILKARGCAIMEPEAGELACRTEGPGRLPEPEDIVEEARMLLSKQDLAGLRILVTAGATLEPLDPVRYMSNRSSGKMGYALARAARMRGGKVTLVSGPTALKPPRDVALSRVKTAEEMRRTVLAECQQYDVIIKAAAVLDWRPKETAEHKIKKGRGVQTLELVENPDILAELGCSRGNSRCLLVGFAAETQDFIANAQEKLKKKNLDLIVVNDVSREDAGFEADTNAVKIVYRDGRMEELPLMTKAEVADQLLDRIKTLWEKSS